jgi:alpha-glucosidase
MNAMRTVAIFCILITQLTPVTSQEYWLTSPGGNLKLGVDLVPEPRLKLWQKGKEIIEISVPGLKVLEYPNGDNLWKVDGVQWDSLNEIVVPVIREKSASIPNHFHELTLSFHSERSITFRLYEKGLAYRWNTMYADSLTIRSEELILHFDETDSAWFQSEEHFGSSYETPYEHERIGILEKGKLLLLPLLAHKKGGPFILVTESDLRDYPGLWFRGTGTNTVESVHPPFPCQYNQEGTPCDFVARTGGSRSYPWRIIAVADTEAELIDNHMVYLLASPSIIGETSWIEPGVVAFDWWAKMNIYGVDFRAGINTETAKYFIDFCAAYGFKYFLFDDGWSPRENLLSVVPGLDMEEVAGYAKKKGVKLMLWVYWKGLKNQFEEAFDQFGEWGIEGIKMDFMNRDDQPMVRFIEEVAEEAARRKMVVNYHGVYKPAGLRRTYPNILTREGLIEFEYNGWSHHDSPEHHNLLPYIRMFTGPMDYIPATMRNATPSNFRPVNDYPMGQGTRAHSMALFVILNSPMTMLPDSPSDYYRETECTEFLAQVPVEWDETRLLQGQVGDYTILARRNSNDWFVGAITDETGRDIALGTDFLADGKYSIEFIQDGINAGLRANDYTRGEWIIYAGEQLNLSLAPAGGWVAKISPIPNEGL